MKFIHKIIYYLGFRLITVKKGAGIIIEPYPERICHNIEWNRFTRLVRKGKILVIDKSSKIFTKKKEFSDFRNYIILLDQQWNS